MVVVEKKGGDCAWRYSRCSSFEILEVLGFSLAAFSRGRKAGGSA